MSAEQQAAPATVPSRDLIAAGAVVSLQIGNVEIRASLEISDLVNLRAALTPPERISAAPIQQLGLLQIATADKQPITDRDREQLRQGLDRLLAP
jgi:hypothetical protein